VVRQPGVQASAFTHAGFRNTSWMSCGTTVVAGCVAVPVESWPLITRSFEVDETGRRWRPPCCV